MKFLTEKERAHISSWCNILSGGAFVGGFMFNTFGLGQDLRLAGISLVIVLVWFLVGFLFRRGGE
jgi:hypothetical protein